MTDLFAAKPTTPRPAINKSHLRGAIWLLALAAFVLLPKPSEADAGRSSAAEIVGSN